MFPNVRTFTATWDGCKFNFPVLTNTKEFLNHQTLKTHEQNVKFERILPQDLCEIARQKRKRDIQVYIQNKERKYKN